MLVEIIKILDIIGFKKSKIHSTFYTISLSYVLYYKFNTPQNTYTVNIKGDINEKSINITRYNKKTKINDGRGWFFKEDSLEYFKKWIDSTNELSVILRQNKIKNLIKSQKQTSL